jgi:polyhydroxybutyrate depolymerase
MKWSLVLAVACSNQPRVAAPPRPVVNAPTSAVSAAPARRLGICSAAPIQLQGPPGAAQSRGCIVTFTQHIASEERERRYLVYAPANLPDRPVPVVLAFPGYTESAEALAFYDTHTEFERLADRDGFVVVYGNGLPDPPSPREHVTLPMGGFFQGCLLAHDDEGIDVTYVRRIIAQLAGEISIDRSRIYATGLSAGGGMAFELALEAPDLVAAIAPVVPLPFEPKGPWLLRCHPHAGYERISIAMVAATADPFISYGPGPSREFPDARYPGMEAARDAWVQALGLMTPPAVDELPDVVHGDSFEPDTRRTTSLVRRQRYSGAADGRELWFYEAVGMGHAWPNPTQLWQDLWPRFGKTNQDIDFADEAWSFFKRHAKAG